MQIKAILTTLVLGTASVAVAQPYQPNDYYTHDETNVFDWRGAWYARSQFVLARDVTLAPHQGSFIRIDPRLRVSRVRLDLTSGRAYVQSVFVTFANGQRATIPVGRMISPRMPQLVINLPARRITGVAINSAQMRSARGGGYRRMHEATVDVIAVRQ